MLYLGTQVGLVAMFVDRKVGYSALFTTLVRWHAGAVSFPLSDVILAQLAFSLSDIMFYLHSGITNLSLQTLVVGKLQILALNTRDALPFLHSLPLSSSLIQKTNS